MARQLRQTRGKKGPRKTRKQGKRKGGKTRKRVMGKRRKRTMRGGGLFSVKVKPVISAQTPTPTSINEDGANKYDYVKLTGDIDKDNIIGKEPKEGSIYRVTYHKDDSMMVLEDMNTHEFLGIRTGMSDTKNKTIFAFEDVDQHGNPIPIKKTQRS